MVAYTYDANKNKTAETLSGVMQPYGFNTTTYDNENRLTAWNRADGNKNQSWSLSAAGDWNSFTENGTTQNRTHSAVHSLSTVDNTTLVHDLKGNLTTNSNGNTYAWDYDNRMKSAVVSGNTHGYAYDALGRRVAKVVSDGTNTVTTVYVSDGQQEIAEYVGGTAATSPTKKYVYADYVDEPLAMVSGGNTYFYHQNNLYSVAALSDAAGNVVEHYAYNAYGKPIICSASGDVLTASSVGNPYLFTGRRLDSETGLQYSRARYYSFDLGRFIGRDPIGYAGGMNLYGYVGGMVLVATDPKGLKEVCGPRVWLYTDSWCIDERIYNAALEAGGKPADKILSCWWDCMVDVHGGSASGPALGGANNLLFTHLEIPKPPEYVMFPGAGSGEVATLQRILGQRLRDAGFERIAARLHKGATAVSKSPLKTGAGSVVSGIAITECMFSVVCRIVCN